MEVQKEYTSNNNNNIKRQSQFVSHDSLTLQPTLQALNPSPMVLPLSEYKVESVWELARGLGWRERKNLQLGRGNLDNIDWGSLLPQNIE